ncbi:Peroxisomal (S)-2-hydroxy-acid oxidase GLO5 [Melipona quadrifasciata]|uniref:(S)-2-hydroxy-acid oxidase n=1 Tax=Melipona quadrifasciata TaxID=166423 RepID=A0A0N0BI34_9HYME|nr:Peroxisomal (S)-2-hydroxy-acid oxidase GLO5 [Melipona quadrifasciata]
MCHHGNTGASYIWPPHCQILNDNSYCSPPHISNSGSYPPNSQKNFALMANSPPAITGLLNGSVGFCRSSAAQGAGTIYVLSTISTSSIEEVAEAAPNAIKWFQLYIYKDRNVTLNLVSRAERAGFKALVLTVDAPLFGDRRLDIKNKFSLPSHLRLGNFEGELSTKINNAESGSGLNEYVMSLFDASVTWNDIKWLKSITKLPLVLKGILTPQDALLAIEYGAAAIVVSNHGARQIDTIPATIEALSEITKAVNGRIEIYMDGGVRQGVDVLKALALGAKMVFVGRPMLWGCATVDDAARDMIQHESYYSHL